MKSRGSIIAKLFENGSFRVVSTPVLDKLFELHSGEALTRIPMSTKKALTEKAVQKNDTGQLIQKAVLYCEANNCRGKRAISENSALAGLTHRQVCPTIISNYSSRKRSLFIFF